jgi:hypothetical protein
VSCHVIEFAKTKRLFASCLFPYGASSARIETAHDPPFLLSLLGSVLVMDSEEE